MDRERLIKKREALKTKLEFEGRLGRIDDLLKHLDYHKIKYRIYLDCEKAEQALYSYPAEFSGLNWGKIPNSEKVFYCSDAERNKIISTVIRHYLDKSDTTFVIWADSYKPILEITASLMAENSGAMADEDFDMWVLNLEKGFCLEHYHEGHVAWTALSSRSPLGHSQLLL
ncbi:MAG: hypothetical protein AAFO95_09415 [Cyanobacteria bacterium J06600_6]